MTEQTQELIKLALQVVIAIGAVAAAVIGWSAKKAIQEVHVSLNSRLTQLLAQTADASRAEGRDSMRVAFGPEAPPAETPAPTQDTEGTP